MDPKDAKAPEPSPKAEEAPVVGEAIFEVVNGEIPFNVVVLPPLLPSPAYLFEAEYVREGSSLVDSLFEFDVDNESLLELLHHLAIILGIEANRTSLLRASLPEIVHEYKRVRMICKTEHNSNPS